MKSLLLATLVVLIPLGTIAQETRARRVPNASPPAVARPLVKQAQPAKPRVPGLSKNVTLSIEGDLQGLVPIDLELTGCGPKFHTDYNLPVAAGAQLPAPIITIEVVLTEIDDGFYVEYSMGARVAEFSDGQRAPGGARSVSFRNLLLDGAARLNLGEPLVLSKIAGKTLKLTVAEAK